MNWTVIIGRIIFWAVSILAVWLLFNVPYAAWCLLVGAAWAFALINEIGVSPSFIMQVGRKMDKLKWPNH